MTECFVHGQFVYNYIYFNVINKYMFFKFIMFNNNNNIYLLQLGCYPEAVVILHVHKI